MAHRRRPQHARKSWTDAIIEHVPTHNGPSSTNKILHRLHKHNTNTNNKSLFKTHISKYPCKKFSHRSVNFVPVLLALPYAFKLDPDLRVNFSMTQCQADLKIITKVVQRKEKRRGERRKAYCRPVKVTLPLPSSLVQVTSIYSAGSSPSTNPLTTPCGRRYQ